MPLTKEQLDQNVTYRFNGPRMNQMVPENQVAGNEQGRLVGVDGRYNGALRKYYGNLELVRLGEVTGLTDLLNYAGLSYFQEVTFQKRTTSTIYRGFVLRWDDSNDTDNQAVSLAYTTDNGSTWTHLAIWSGGSTGITSTTEIDVATHAGYLMVAVDGKATKTVYWSGSALTVVSSGPGNFSSAMSAMTESSQSEDTSYNLAGDGVYRVAFRWYSSTRGIYSALSTALNVYMDQSKLSKASGSVAFAATGGDSGLFVDGDVLTLNGRTFEADDDSSTTSDVDVDISGLTTIAQHAQALADAINSDTDNCACTARAESTSVYIEASARGTSGNAYTLSISETGANTDDISVSATTLTGGGEQSTEYLQQCKAVLDLPDSGVGMVYTDSGDGFADLFDTLQIFRSINLGNVPAAQIGAILYHEQDIAKTGNWATSGAWDALQVSIGTLPDAALPFQDEYDPATDTVLAPPQSGTIARYQGVTFMAQALSDDNPYNVVFSNAKGDNPSPEYFTTYNERTGKADRGRALRFLVAGDSAFILNHAGITHMYKGGTDKKIQFVDTMDGFGLDGKYTAHSMGTTVAMISAGSLAQMGGNDANVALISGASRTLKKDWKNDIANSVSSGYDGKLNASFWLNPNRDEILCLWHETQGLSMMEGANFAWMTHGPDITDGKTKRAYFATANGVVVYADIAETGTGTMLGLDSSYTIASTATDGSTTTLVDSSATFHADMVECYLYMLSGNNVGEGKIISSVDVGNKTLTVAAFDNAIAYGDRYTISPVPFKARLAPLRPMDAPKPTVVFDRVTMHGAQAKFRDISGLNTDVDDTIRISAYRNSGTSLESADEELDIVANPADTPGDDLEDDEGFVIDGIDVEPYIEHLGVGTMFEITDLEVSVTFSKSKESG